VSSVTLLRRGTPNGASSGSSSGSSASHRLIPGCSATLGRVKNLEMTEYQKEKLINEANTVKIKVNFLNLSMSYSIIYWFYDNVLSN